MLRSTLMLLLLASALPAQAISCASSTSSEPQGLYYSFQSGYAIRVVAPSRLVVTGFIIPTNLDTSVLMPTSAQLPTALFFANAGGAPNASPVRVGLMSVQRGGTRLYGTTFSPTTVERNQRTGSCAWRWPCPRCSDSDRRGSGYREINITVAGQCCHERPSFNTVCQRRRIVAPGCIARAQAWHRRCRCRSACRNAG